ncbi:MAG: hypothetical protein HY020_21260 [Burkholderiales bacterium]|nr:hypothetical protein [Burkholderiales bacterium]
MTAASIVRIATLALAFGATSCSKTRDLSAADFDVYYFLPKESQGRVLGTVKGLEACGSLAWSQARSDMAPADSWSYICCLVEAENRCVEKHR